MKQPKHDPSKPCSWCNPCPSSHCDCGPCSNLTCEICPKPTSNEEIRKVSGEVNGGKLDVVFYLLMRDHLPAGVLERVVMEAEKCNTVFFTNGWLADYAKNLSDRVREKEKA